MTVNDFYNEIGGDYQEILGRLVTEDRVRRFLFKVLETNDVNLLKEAWSKEDPSQIFMYAHRLKGIALNLSLDNFAKYTSELTEQYRGGNVKDKNVANDYYEKSICEYEFISTKIKEIS